ncbi:MobF family relaxase, partial [Roseomonas mucosa]|uniref:MobF family relaxase n=1 Tax=Roseomonas mucosa TaxID=207340 RepID=UPI002246C42D
MLTYRTGAAGAPSAAQAMAEHLLEQTLPQAQAELATYYQRGLAPAEADAGPGGHDVAAAEPRRDMDPRLAALLGLDAGRAPAVGEIACLLAGLRADGTPIPGKQVQRGGSSLAEELGMDPARVPGPAEIDRVLNGRRADDGVMLPEGRAAALRGRLLALYGVTEGTESSEAGLDHVRAGRRASGEALRQGPLLEGLSAARARIGYVDLCWSADKSVSLAWAMAPTEAERNLIALAHKDAVAAALRHVEAEIGRARKGKGGREGYDPGRIGWVSFDHYASRPTAEVARTDPATGRAYTELVTLKVAGDPQLHTHVAIPNVVLTADGRVGGLDLQRLAGRVHEFGAVYQAFLADNLRRHGAEVALDPVTGAARLVAIPERVREAFSKRTRNGTEAARDFARQAGLDWDALDPARRVALAKQGVQGDPRGAKQDDLGDWASWQRQARALDWRHDGVLGLEAAAAARARRERDREQRLEEACRAAAA